MHATQDAPSPAQPTHADVAAAVLHLARLAASHAGWGVELIGASETALNPYPPDTESVATLAAVTKLLLDHRDKSMRSRAADIQIAKVHEAVTEVYTEAQKSAEAEEHTDDLVGERMKELGIALGPAQMKRFDVNRSHIKALGGPAQAAAAALVDGMEGLTRAKSHGRSVFLVKKRRTKHPPVAAMFNRYVSLRKVRAYVERVLAAAEAQRPPLLPLEALRSDSHSEELLSRDESSFRKRMREDLDRGFDVVSGLFLALLRGESPRPSYPLTPDVEQQWSLLCSEFRELGTLLMSSPDADPAVLNDKAREVAAWWIGWMKKGFDIDEAH